MLVLRSDDAADTDFAGGAVSFEIHYGEAGDERLGLVVAKNGRKLTLNTDGKDRDVNASKETRETRLVATYTTINLLAAYVGNRFHRMVTDQTGLTGNYDFTLT